MTADDGFPVGEEFMSLHLDTYGVLPGECIRCDHNEPMLLMKLDSGGLILVHETQLTKVDDLPELYRHRDYCGMHIGGPCNCLPGMDI